MASNTNHKSMLLPTKKATELLKKNLKDLYIGKSKQELKVELKRLETLVEEKQVKITADDTKFDNKKALQVKNWEALEAHRKVIDGLEEKYKHTEVFFNMLNGGECEKECEKKLVESVLMAIERKKEAIDSVQRAINHLNHRIARWERRKKKNNDMIEEYEKQMKELLTEMKKRMWDEEKNNDISDIIKEPKKTTITGNVDDIMGSREALTKANEIKAKEEDGSVKTLGTTHAEVIREINGHQKTNVTRIVHCSTGCDDCTCEHKDAKKCTEKCKCECECNHCKTTRNYTGKVFSEFEIKWTLPFDLKNEEIKALGVTAMKKVGSYYGVKYSIYTNDTKDMLYKNIETAKESIENARLNKSEASSEVIKWLDNEKGNKKRTTDKQSSAMTKRSDELCRLKSQMTKEPKRSKKERKYLRKKMNERNDGF